MKHSNIAAIAVFINKNDERVRHEVEVNKNNLEIYLYEISYEGETTLTDTLPLSSFEEGLAYLDEISSNGSLEVDRFPALYGIHNKRYVPLDGLNCSIPSYSTVLETWNNRNSILENSPRDIYGEIK